MIGMPLGAPDADWWVGVLASLSEIPFTCANADAALKRVTQVGRQVMRSHACTLTFVDLSRRTLTHVASDGPDDEFERHMSRRTVPLGPDSHIDFDLVARGQSMERYNLTEARRGVADPEIARRYNLHSWLCHPLVSEGELIGYINHFTDSPDEFSTSTRRLLEAFAKQAVIAIERFRWQRTFERSSVILNTLSLNLLAAPTDFLDQVANKACELLDVAVCIVWQRAEKEQKLRIVAASPAVDAEFRGLELELEAPLIQKALATPDVKYISDVSRSRLFAHSAAVQRRGWVSLLTAPMMVGDRLIGILDIYTTSRRAFKPWEKQFFRAFANYAALSISTLSDRRRFKALTELMQRITDARDIDELFELFLDGALDLVGAPMGWISRLDMATGELRIEVVRGGPPSLQPLKWGEGVTGTAVTRVQPLRLDDVDDARWRGIYKACWPGTRSELAIPIVVLNAKARVRTTVEEGSRPLGVLNIESPKLAAFTQADEELLWSLARHAAVVTEKLEFDERITALGDVERRMAHLDTYDDVIREILQTVTSTLGYEYVNISLVNTAANTIKTEHVRGISDVEDFKRQAEHPLDGGDIQADIVRTKTAEVPDQTDKRFDPAIYAKFGHDKLIRVFLPMRVAPGDRVIGTIEAGYNRSHRRYIYERDVQMLQGFADYAALALERRRLRGFNLYLEASLKTALAAAGATGGSLLLLNPETNVLETIERLGPPTASSPSRPEWKVGKGIAGLAVQHRRAYVIGDVEKSAEFVRSGDDRLKSLLVVPIVRGDRAVGVICANSERLDAFNERGREAVDVVAQSIAADIERHAVAGFIERTKRLEQLERLPHVGQELGRLTADLPKLRDLIASEARSIFAADLTILYEYDAKEKQIAGAPTSSGTSADLAALGHLASTDPTPYDVIASGASRYPASGTIAPSPLVEREGILASAVILLRAGGEILGVLLLLFRTRRVFADQERHVVEGFAADAALALQAARAVRATITETHASALQHSSHVFARSMRGPLISMSDCLRRIHEMSSDDNGARQDAIKAALELNLEVQAVVADLGGGFGRRIPSRVTRHDIEESLESTPPAPSSLTRETTGAFSRRPRGKTVRSVLIVDDDRAVAERLGNTFRERNNEDACPYRFEADSAHSVEDAIDRIKGKGDRQDQYDVVILDMVFDVEGKDRPGVELAEWLPLYERSLGLSETQRRPPPVKIVFTAWGSPETCVRAVRSGTWDYIEKLDTEKGSAFERVVDSAIARLDAYDLKARQHLMIVNDWMPRNFDRLQREHGGEFVAIWHDPEVEVIASASDPFALQKEVKSWRQQTGVTVDPFVIQIARRSEEVVNARPQTGDV